VVEGVARVVCGEVLVVQRERRATTDDDGLAMVEADADFAGDDQLRGLGIPTISLNMAGSIVDHVDLVVSNPVQAGTMAVLAVAGTASFDLARQRGNRY